MIRRPWYLGPIIESALWTCAAIVLGALAITALTGCPARPPITDCTPNATQCGPNGPQVCSPERRWYDTAPEPCPEGSTCCLSASPDGPPIHACVAPAGCVPEDMARVAEPGTATADDAAEEHGSSPAAAPASTRDPWGEDGGAR